MTESSISLISEQNFKGINQNTKNFLDLVSKGEEISRV